MVESKSNIEAKLRVMYEGVYKIQSDFFIVKKGETEYIIQLSKGTKEKIIYKLIFSELFEELVYSVTIEGRYTYIFIDDKWLRHTNASVWGFKSEQGIVIKAVIDNGMKVYNNKCENILEIGLHTDGINGILENKMGYDGVYLLVDKGKELHNYDTTKYSYETGEKKNYQGKLDYLAEKEHELIRYNWEITEWD